MTDNLLAELEPVQDAPLTPSVAISALALNLALKWHDMCLIKDGSLYQQKKLEGANITLIDMPDVLATAQRFEAWLLSGQVRHANILRSGVIDQLVGVVSDIVEGALEAEEGQGDDRAE